MEVGSWWVAFDSIVASTAWIAVFEKLSRSCDTMETLCVSGTVTPSLFWRHECGGEKELSLDTLSWLTSNNTEHVTTRVAPHGKELARGKARAKQSIYFPHGSAPFLALHPAMAATMALNLSDGGPLYLSLMSPLVQRRRLQVRWSRHSGMTHCVEGLSQKQPQEASSRPRPRPREL